jgi:flagellar motor switch protein FliM
MMANDAAETTILKRMAQAGGGVASVPARIFGTSIAKAAEAVLGLPVAVPQVHSVPVTLADLAEHLEDRALLALVEGPGERLGLAALSPGLVATVIEMMTTGGIAKAEPTLRRATRTDASLCAGLVDRVLSETDDAAAEGADPWVGWETRFRYASSVEDARLLPLLLEDTRYQLYRCALSLGADGERSGTLSMILPEVRRTAARAPGTEVAEAAGWQSHLTEALLEAEAGITAVLARVMRPVSEVMVLEPGGLLRLPDDAISRVRLEGAGRRFLTEARLGQYRGYLAVRLTGMPEGRAQPGSVAALRAGEDFELPLEVTPAPPPRAAAS